MSVRRITALAALLLGLGLGLGGPGTRAAAAGWPHPAAGEGPPGAIEVLFTFDDGPHPVITPEVLDILAAHGIRAVFFIVGEQLEGNKAANAEILARIVDEGHIVANHTMRHTDLCKTPAAFAAADLDVGRETIERALGMRLGWFRAPFGARCARLEDMLAERGLFHFGWDIDPQEWRHGNLERTVRYVTGMLARATGRNVVLMHDLKQVTVKALPEILRWIDEENFWRGWEGKPQIRILQAPAFALERLPPDLMAWLAEAAAGVRELPQRIAAVLP